jgi:hypothetical protein
VARAKSALRGDGSMQNYEEELDFMMVAAEFESKGRLVT